MNLNPLGAFKDKKEEEEEDDIDQIPLFPPEMALPKLEV